MTQYTASMKRTDALLMLKESIKTANDELRVLADAFHAVGNDTVCSQLNDIRFRICGDLHIFVEVDQEASQSELNAARGAVGDILKELVAPSNKELA